MNEHKGQYSVYEAIKLYVGLDSNYHLCHTAKTEHDPNQNKVQMQQHSRDDLTP